jgi:hypothetical protein
MIPSFVGDRDYFLFHQSRSPETKASLSSHVVSPFGRVVMGALIKISFFRLVRATINDSTFRANLGIFFGAQPTDLGSVVKKIPGSQGP